MIRFALSVIRSPRKASWIYQPKWRRTGSTLRSGWATWSATATPSRSSGDSSDNRVRLITSRFRKERCCPIPAVATHGIGQQRSFRNRDVISLNRLSEESPLLLDGVAVALHVAQPERSVLPVRRHFGW